MVKKLIYPPIKFIGRGLRFSPSMCNIKCSEVSQRILSQWRGAPHSTVGKFVTVKASNFNKAQQLSTNSSQKVQYQSLHPLDSFFAAGPIIRFFLISI